MYTAPSVTSAAPANPSTFASTRRGRRALGCAALSCWPTCPSPSTRRKRPRPNGIRGIGRIHRHLHGLAGPIPPDDQLHIAPPHALASEHELKAIPVSGVCLARHSVAVADIHADFAIPGKLAAIGDHPVGLRPGE